MCVVIDDQLNDPFIEEGDSNDQTQLAQLCGAKPLARHLQHRDTHKS